jgi:DNA-binding NarL/FixJ family response regulator
VEIVPDLERGRRAYAAAAWGEAFQVLTAADRSEPLPAPDLELLGRAAYMLGLDEDYLNAFERAYRAHVDAGLVLAAVRCAFWIGHSWFFRGHASPALGWFARAERLLGRERADNPGRGYVLIGVMLGHLSRGDAEAALGAATEIAEIGERFGDADLLAMGMMERGHALVRLGRAEEGARLIDETMVAVTTGELSPIVAGIVYCNTIAFCRGVYQLRRVREWTVALTRWCERQPEMVAHKGLCLVHRAEIMTLSGAWDDAIEELRRLAEQLATGALNRLACGDAAYREGEVHRLRGEFELAEAAYQKASGLGREPQPGLSLMRLTQGNVDSAAASISRAISEASRGLPRVDLLPAYAEIMVAAGDLGAAEGACRELDEIAEEQHSEAIDAMCWHARGVVALAEGDPQTALAAARRAWQGWQQLEAPYEAARSRGLVGRACQMLGDADSAALEFRAARMAFTELGARPELAGLDSYTWTGDCMDGHGLSPREKEVLRLVATGQSNREIATALVLSEHTVARHLQNIFAKLGVSSRTAATAFAYEHHIV